MDFPWFSLFFPDFHRFSSQPQVAFRRGDLVWVLGRHAARVESAQGEAGRDGWRGWCWVFGAENMALTCFFNVFVLMF